MKHPMQPLVRGEQGIFRFKENKIIGYLFDNGLLNLNKLAVMDFDDNDREQVAQLLGYSIDGYGELPYVTDESYDMAHKNRTKIEEEP